MTLDLTTALTQTAKPLHCTPDDIRRFAEHLNRLPTYQAARINPFAFADQAGMSRETAVDLFVLGTRQGHFDLEWGTICPMCSAIMQTTQALDHIAEDKVFCQFCSLELESVLDDTVEVSFSYVPSDTLPDLHNDFATYRHYFTSGSHPLRDFFTDYQNRNRVADLKLDARESKAWDVPVDADDSYRIMCLDTHAAFDIHAKAEAGAKAPEIELAPGGFSERVVELSPGQHALTVTNCTDIPVWLHMVRVRYDEIAPVIQGRDLTFGPRLTGKHLLSNQTFRDSFALDNLAPDLKLKLRSLTLLFTDLKGSTALYDREGDLAAYRLVQDHFVALKDVVRTHSGAMIKTMGDAVMAAFPSGEDGVRAAVRMMEAMQDVTRKSSYADDVGLKVGLHTGPALAINAGRSVDYFGQTVNIAARVQGLADEGDICLSSALAGDKDIGAILTGAGYTGHPEQARLKGVSADEHIMRYNQ